MALRSRCSRPGLLYARIEEPQRKAQRKFQGDRQVKVCSTEKERQALLTALSFLLAI